MARTYGFMGIWLGILSVVVSAHVAVDLWPAHIVAERYGLSVGVATAVCVWADVVVVTCALFLVRILASSLSRAPRGVYRSEADARPCGPDLESTTDDAVAAFTVTYTWLAHRLRITLREMSREHFRSRFTCKHHLRTLEILQATALHRAARLEVLAGVSDERLREFAVTFMKTAGAIGEAVDALAGLFRSSSTALHTASGVLYRLLDALDVSRRRLIRLQRTLAKRSSSP